MYTVDQNDSVEWADAPAIDGGAPLPLILCSDYQLALAYYVSARDSITSQIVHAAGEKPSYPIALIQFTAFEAVMFGPPNDEAFGGHPLAGRGLQPYGTYRIVKSSWVRQLERMNSVHENHDPKKYEVLKHFIFVFHDSTFECVADGFRIEMHSGTMAKIIPKMQALVLR